jgi:hypothetical protein
MPKKKKTGLTRRQRKVRADVEKLRKVSEDLELGLKKVKNELGSPLGNPVFSPKCPKN